MRASEASSVESAGAIRERELRALGVRTRVLEVGEASDEAVLFVHGGPGSANDWESLLPPVAELGRVVAFDLPGFGKADRPAEWGYSSNEWATFIAAVLGQLGIRRVHLVSNDLGGSAGLAWAAAHPEAFASVVLINSGSSIGYRWHLLASMHRTPLVGRLIAGGGRLGLRAAMRLYEPGLPRAVIARWQVDFDWGTRRALLRFYRASPPSALSRIAPDLARLDRPALIIWGAGDRFVPVEQAERERACFPSAEIVRLEGSRHYPHLEDPQPVADRVVPFIREQLG